MECGRTTGVELVRDWLQEVKVQQGVHHRNLTLFPLVRDGNGAEREEESAGAPTWCEVPGGSHGTSRYVLLQDAIAQGAAEVREVSEGGSVPFLAVDNRGRVPVLLPEGEILVGAKQNRVVNLTVLVAAGSTFRLPVSCVEQGRWHYRSRHFEAGAWAHPKLRGVKVRSAQQSRNVAGVALSDQGAVWGEVEDHLLALGAASETRDFVDSYRQAGDRLTEYRRAISCPKGACGFVVARGEQIIGLELFDTPETLQTLWDRLANSYFAQASRDRSPAPRSKDATARSFLSAVGKSLTPAPSQPELGLELELDGDELTGSGLWFEGAICHLAAFSA